MKTLMFFLQIADAAGSSVDWIKTVFVIMGWILSVFLALLGLAIIKKIFNKEIDLVYLICDETGKPSLARFQNLIFTVVIAMGLFYLIGAKGAFPEIPNGIWVLLGISAGTFAAGKAIETSRAVRMRELDIKEKQLNLNNGG